MSTANMTSEGSTLPTPLRVEGGDKLDIRCPRCGKRSIWEEPFSLYVERMVPEHAITPQMHRWSGHLVVERYPSILPWVAPPGSPQGVAAGPNVLETGGIKTPADARRAGYHVMRQRGVVRCPHCHLVAIHYLRWPQDAYFQWIIRGNLLWAWSGEHAHVLLAFLVGSERDGAKYPAYAQSLRNLPKQVITAEVRPLIVKRITKTLSDGERRRRM